MITNPTPQRALRGHLPTRPTPRAAATGEHHGRLAARLTPRDRWLAAMLLEHRVLTTHQIAQLAWPSVRAANLRLLSLYRWRVVDRFQPFITSGTAPMHYVLDTAGAAILAHEAGLDPHQLGYRHDRAIGIAHSLRLAHTVGVNSFFTTLVHHSHTPQGTGKLTAWWSETRCARHFGDIVCPDAYGRWTNTTTSTETDWFLEFDFGTEQLATLAAKLTDYERLAAITGITTPVLIWLPTARREATARRALTTALQHLNHPELVPVATASPGTIADIDPAGALWTPLSSRANGPRVPLGELTWPDLRTALPIAKPAIPVEVPGGSDLSAPPPTPQM